MLPVVKQYRGTVILERPEGILVDATSRGAFILPGGRTKHGEGRLQAAIRELREETGLRAYAAVELFTFEAPPYTERGFQDFHKVFYVRADGVPKPLREVRKVAFVAGKQAEVDGTRVSAVTLEIISRYKELKKREPGLFEALERQLPRR